MQASLIFSLPEETEAHQAALDAPKWKDVVTLQDRTLRDWLKHGHIHKTPDEALQAIRDKLYEAMGEAGLSLYT
jgi:hypothetical protein